MLSKELLIKNRKNKTRKKQNLLATLEWFYLIGKEMSEFFWGHLPKMFFFSVRF